MTGVDVFYLIHKAAIFSPEQLTLGTEALIVVCLISMVEQKIISISL